MSTTAPEGVRIEIIGRVNSNRSVNVLHARSLDTPLSVSDAENIAVAASAGWVDNILPLLSSDYTLDEVVVTDITSATGSQGADSTGGTGGVGTDSLPPQVALAVTLRTAVRSRTGRGRAFISGVPTSAVTATDSHLATATFADDLDAGWQDFMGDLTANSLPLTVNLAVFSRKDGVVREVESHDVNRPFDTQRRRSHPSVI